MVAKQDQLLTLSCERLQTTICSDGQPDDLHIEAWARANMGFVINLLVQVHNEIPYPRDIFETQLSSFFV